VANFDWFANLAIEFPSKFFDVAVLTGLEPVTFGLGVLAGFGQYRFRKQSSVSSIHFTRPFLQQFLCLVNPQLQKSLRNLNIFISAVAVFYPLEEAPHFLFCPVFQVFLQSAS